MKPFLLLFGLLLVVPATGQEHAPTAAQCQADAAVWGDTDIRIEFENAETAFLRNGTPNRTDVNRLAAEEVRARITEMAQCEKVDAPRITQYGDVASFYNEVFSARMFNFISRHDFWPQFKLEDSQGKR